MILVTGGAGYIGGHCVLKLLENNKSVVVFDNLSTGHLETIDILKNVKDFKFVKGDIRNPDDLNEVFKNYKIDSVFHFAGLSQVNESFENPEKYEENNVIGTYNLLNSMVLNNVKKIIFSSTASIYGEPSTDIINENHPCKPINPYGRTKLTIENMLDEFDKKYGLKSVRLRYFNAIGADFKTRIGEWHNPETHLIPNILKTMFDKNKVFKLFGDDYNTKDGTCVRDYVDVEDLIDAHILALNYLDNGGLSDYFNLGSNTGCSILEVFEVVKEVTSNEINYEITKRRKGDPAYLVANNQKAQKILNWKPKRSLKDSIKTAYAWENYLSKTFSI